MRFSEMIGFVEAWTGMGAARALPAAVHRLIIAIWGMYRCTPAAKAGRVHGNGLIDSHSRQAHDQRIPLRARLLSGGEGHVALGGYLLHSIEVAAHAGSVRFVGAMEPLDVDT